MGEGGVMERGRDGGGRSDRGGRSDGEGRE